MFNVSTRTIFNVFPSIFDIENLDKAKQKKKKIGEKNQDKVYRTSAVLV